MNDGKYLDAMNALQQVFNVFDRAEHIAQPVIHRVAVPAFQPAPQPAPDTIESELRAFCNRILPDMPSNVINERNGVNDYGLLKRFSEGDNTAGAELDAMYRAIVDARRWNVNLPVWDILVNKFEDTELAEKVRRLPNRVKYVLDEQNYKWRFVKKCVGLWRKNTPSSLCKLFGELSLPIHNDRMFHRGKIHLRKDLGHKIALKLRIGDDDYDRNSVGFEAYTELIRFGNTRPNMFYKLALAIALHESSLPSHTKHNHEMYKLIRNAFHPIPGRTFQMECSGITAATKAKNRVYVSPKGDVSGEHSAIRIEYLGKMDI
jgi:hypothetical protein